MRKLFVFIITAYQMALSPIFKVIVGNGKFCRFEETCSMYTKRMILEKGILPGLLLGSVRLMKCQPFYHGNLSKELYGNS